MACGHLQRAIERGDVLAATSAAKQLPHLRVANALALVLLYAETDDPRFSRAAARWHALFVFEAPERQVTRPCRHHLVAPVWLT